jgi:hypothetical protein
MVIVFLVSSALALTWCEAVPRHFARLVCVLAAIIALQAGTIMQGVLATPGIPFLFPARAVWSVLVVICLLEIASVVGRSAIFRRSAVVRWLVTVAQRLKPWSTDN